MDFAGLLNNLNTLSDAEIVDLFEEITEIEEREQISNARNSLIAFCIYMMDGYKVGPHHRQLAALLEDIERGEKDRITVSVPPRHGKTQLVSLFYGAWFLGRNPTMKVMLVSHTTDLAVDFGRKVRNLIATDKYKRVFPDTSLASDSKSAGRWNTNQGGEFFACGTGAALAGRGADLLLVDDPFSEQDVLNGNYEAFEKTYQWFTFGARTRLMPGGRIAIVMTRWHQEDLVGRVIQDMARDPETDQYEVFEFPAILNEKAENEKALWPEFFDLEALRRIKAGMPLFQWNAQYMQSPTAEEAALIKREWWQDWAHEEPPTCEYIIVSMDAAAETHNRADYTSITVWGVFFNDEWEEKGGYNIILLNAIKDRFEFPELKRKAMQVWNDWEPDSFIVEKKSAGVALYQEMRRMGLPITEFTPHRGTGDKVARVNSVADIVSSGLVWVPRHRWAEGLVEECAAFPFGSHDDQVDSTVQALMRFRQGGFLKLPSDEPDEIQYFRSRSKRRYY